MAGGRGERLWPLTDICPKPLLQFGSRNRIIDFTLYNCLKSKAVNTFVLTQYLSKMLEEYLDQNWKGLFFSRNKYLGIIPSYMAPKRKYHGTADAVYQTLTMLHQIPDYVVVLSGDHVYKMDYQKMIGFHISHNKAVTVGAVTCKREDAHRFGIIEADNNKIRHFYEKPKDISHIESSFKGPLASMGIYVFSGKPLFKYLQKNQNEKEHDFGYNIISEMADNMHKRHPRSWHTTLNGLLCYQYLCYVSEKISIPA
jgi:glucose-1-phosphate adenylyltransferase